VINLPDTEAPKPVAEATEQLATAQARLDDARRERQSREAALKEAAALDRQALADRLVHDPDARPSSEHRSRAQSELDEVQEIEAACQQNLEAAIERAAQAALEHLADWRQSVEEARVKSDRVFERAVGKLREAEQARSELSGVSAWLDRLAENGELWLKGGAAGTVKPAAGPMALPGRLSLRDARHADSKLSTLDAIAALDEYAQASSVQGEREAEQQRAEHERQAEERREHMRQARAGVIQPR
jgi:hypothetical protein